MQNLSVRLEEKGLQWLGCVTSDKTRISRRALQLKYKGKGPVGCPTRRWYWILEDAKRRKRADDK
jgi:hypothetical protein